MKPKSSLVLKIRRIYFRLFKRYQRLDLKIASYAHADQLIRECIGKPEIEQWVLAKEEDTNRCFGVVYLERRVRITE